jgi:transposase
MSLQPEPIGSIPAETVRIARAACPKGTLAMRLRDRVGSIFEDEQFAALSPRRGQGAQAPWQLALVILLQYVDGRTDRQAADAVRERIDWKYALVRRAAHGDIPGAARRN